MSRPRFTIAALMSVVALAGLGFAALRNANAFWANSLFTVAVSAVLFATAGALSRQGRARLPWLGFALFGSTALLLWFATAQNAGLSGFGFAGGGPGGRAAFGGGVGMPGGAGGGGGGFGGGSGFGGGGVTGVNASFGGPGGAFSAIVRMGSVPPLLPMWGFQSFQSQLGRQGAATRVDLLAYVQVSHSLEVILFGLAGAFVCRFATAREDRDDATTASPFEASSGERLD